MVNLFKQAMDDFPAFRKVAYVIWALIPIGGIFLFRNDLFVERNTKFVPYSAKVVSFRTDKSKRGGIYCQNIKLNNGTLILANGFSSEIQGGKIRLTDYIAIGDSVVCDSTDDIICVHRVDSEIRIFTYSPDDFRN